jgi:nucleotide-binding universal stress UspA family protein
MHLQHILVPLDFCPHAEWALDAATTFAKPCQSRLTLLHVLHIPAMSDIHAAAYVAAIEMDAHEGLVSYQKRMQDAGLRVAIRIVRGVPYREIVDIARDMQADLIIMGTHGRTGIPHLLLGSVAERVVRVAPCAVMVVRHSTVTTSP